MSDQTAAELARRPVQYETGFTLLPGKYVIKFLARDAETGRIGTYQAAFAIPESEPRVETRADQLGGPRAASALPLGDAIYTVKKDARPNVNPLVFEGQKLLPSVTRVFSRGRELFVFLQAYQRGETDHAAAGGLCHVLSRRRQGARDGAAGGDRRSWISDPRRCRCASACRSGNCRLAATTAR